MSGPIIKTFEQIVPAVLAIFGDKSEGRVTNFNVGSVVRTLLEAPSQVTAELYAYGADLLKQAHMDTASGIWLARRAAEFGVEKKEAITIEGQVMFSRKTARSTNVPISRNSIVATRKNRLGKDYRYFTTEDAVLEAGSLSVTVPVIAEGEGSAYNVLPGTIVEMRTYIAGIDAVTNESNWIITTGADAEKDPRLRQRGFKAWDELSLGRISGLYESLALSVAGVADAWVDDSQPRGEGTLDVYILDETGPPAEGSAILQAVQAVLDAKRPATEDVRARTPNSIRIDLVVGVIPKAGYDPSLIHDEVEHRLAIKFGVAEDTEDLGITPLGVGKDVMISQLVAVAMAVEGVYAVHITSMTVTRPGALPVVSSPAQDLPIDANEFPDLGTLTVNMEAASDE